MKQYLNTNENKSNFWHIYKSRYSILIGGYYSGLDLLELNIYNLDLLFLLVAKLSKKKDIP